MLSFSSLTDNPAISGLLFDFGGTLDSDGGHWLDRFLAIYPKVGLAAVEKSLIKEAFYAADEQAYADPWVRTARLRAMMERHCEWQFGRLKLEDAAKRQAAVDAFVRAAERILRRNRNVLARLASERYRMGVVSNFYGNVALLCDEAGFSPYLQVVADSALVGAKKPDPAIFLWALERLKVPAGRVGFIGDSFERDMRPAKALGMTTFWIIGDSRRVPPEPGVVDHIIYSLEDLPDLLRELKDRA